MSFTTNPLSPALGAEIIGLDLAAEPGDDEFDALGQAWWDAGGVVVLRDQSLSPKQHIAFSKRLGPLEVHVLRTTCCLAIPRSTGSPTRSRMENPRAVRRPAPTGIPTFSYMRPPAMASLLYAIEIPPIGGDTRFANMTAARDSLTPAMQEMISNLSAVHDFTYASRGVFRGERPTAAQLDAAPAVTHPLVKIHPETGRKSLYVNPGFTSHITELSPEESEALLGFLFRHSTRPEFIYRHRWRLHDLVMWDNRCTTHYAVADYDATGERYMHRTTVMWVEE